MNGTYSTAQNATFRTIAVLVSRVEAMCLASMLESHGVATYISGEWHASVEINSLVLGGHRIDIHAQDFVAASNLIREVGAHENWQFSLGLRKAVLKLLTFWAGIYALLLIPASVMGLVPPSTLLAVPFVVLGMPVNPQGAGDYYLAEISDI